MRAPPRTGRERARLAAALLPALLAAALPGCAEDAGPGPSGSRADTVAVARPRYTREYVFVGERADAPLVVPFSFRATDTGADIERSARGWLALAETWDPFLSEAWTTPRPSGVWRILPRGRLQIAADGPLDLGSIWFEEGERRLRLDLAAPISGWSQGDDARYRFRRAELRLGKETVPGTVVETLQIRHPAAAEAEPEDYDWLFLVSGDSLRLVVAEAMGGQRAARRTFAWALREGSESWWGEAQVRWIEMRPLEEARRDIPLRWSYRIPEAEIHGEVRAMGYDFALGPERGGRRAVEVRYTVEGWIEIGGRQARVVGTIRHEQG